MNKKFFVFALALASALGGTFALGAYLLFFEKPPQVIAMPERNTKFAAAFDRLAKDFTVPEGMNFVLAAERTTPAVVHIKVYYNERTEFMEMFQDEYGGKNASGSGVIISHDGYILTNHHVIDDAERIEVVLDDKRSFDAAIIGEDPTTDLALVKVQAQDLPHLEFGNSDEVKVGEWVLAVGNPFDLTSTVTAGIVSAKGRNIQILKNFDGLAIESFIQTDAAVNPGNSGGALVNLKGEVIGINTAIATRTGGYAGYSFAVPSMLAKKVAEDLLRHGEVQRALLGISIRDVDTELARHFNLAVVRGVYVDRVNEGSAAADAGIETGDVIISVGGEAVNTVAELQEQVARHRPGERVAVVYERRGQRREVSALLKNRNNETGVIKTAEHIQSLGADVSELNNAERKRLNLAGGLRIVRLREGKLKQQRVREGFIITHLNKKQVKNIAELKLAIAQANERLMVEGLDASGEKAFFSINF